MRVRLPALLLAALAAAVPSNARAQETREAEWAAEQARKAAEIKQYVPSAAERWVVKLKHEFIEQPSGFYPYFGSVYSGGGFTLGAGYRQFYGDRTHWDVKGLYSLKSYKFLEFSTDSWGHAQGKIDLHGRVGLRDATQVAFYGLGMGTVPEDKTAFRLKQGYVGGNADVRPVKFVVFGAAATYEDYSMGSGLGAAPSIEEIFTPATAPGLGVSPKYLHTTGSAGLDSRPAPGYARRGSLVEVRYHNYADQDKTYSFDRADGEIVQHIPILRETWVISLHGLVQTTLSDSDQVPYFLLPSMGSGSTLRAYPSWRFRDRHSMLMSGEFRWIPSRLAIDMALFYDTGKVAPRWDDLSFKGLKSDVGIGIRFHGPVATPLRIELAKGSEGYNIVFGGSAAF